MGGHEDPIYARDRKRRCELARARQRDASEYKRGKRHLAHANRGKAAIRIQSGWRGFIVRRSVAGRTIGGAAGAAGALAQAKGGVVLPPDPLYIGEEGVCWTCGVHASVADAQATRIQAVVRGNIHRKLASEKRDEYIDFQIRELEMAIRMRELEAAASGTAQNTTTAEDVGPNGDKGVMYTERQAALLFQTLWRGCVVRRDFGKTKKRLKLEQLEDYLGFSNPQTNARILCSAEFAKLPWYHVRELAENAFNGRELALSIERQLAIKSIDASVAQRIAMYDDIAAIMDQ